MRKILTPLLLGAVLLWTELLPLKASAQKSPEETVAGLTAAPGLAVKLWASEPMLQKPTDMDIDARGRVWICEGTNYRRRTTKPEGDCIVILEDTKHTGVCDTRKVFVQDKALNAPLGICVLGNKVIVAMAPNVLIYTIDASGDHPVGPPQVLFTGFEGANHDHGVHAAVFGPDGRLYFNSGNEGTRGYIYHDGKPVTDSFGSEIGHGSKVFRGHAKERGETGYQDGMAFSCNLDGSDFEVVGWNFRNNYELCVDSFGTVWQSDNDDDGNQGVRINYVMEGGNFGYKGPTGTDWNRDMSVFPGQTRQEAHWHELWPGVVPNLLHTGAGAPTGILCYEGDLLPPLYRNQILHADAGKNVIRAYLTHPSQQVPTGISPVSQPGDLPSEADKTNPGAGYGARMIEILKLNENNGDRWFRPADLCVAPDGSVYIADWYDPGVGGHATGDTVGNLHGRVYRLAPPGSAPSVPNLDVGTVAGQIAALCSPNMGTRYLGYTALAGGGEASVGPLQELYRSPNPRYRARALWLLARTANGPKFVAEALKDPDVDIRVAAIRAARQIKLDMVAVGSQMMSDSSPFVWRELCLAMRFEPTQRALPVLVQLASKYDGHDRWYLEAFGIGCTGRENEVLAAWREQNAHPDAAVAQGIAWRLNKEPVPFDQALSGEKNPILPPDGHHNSGSVAPNASFTLSASADPHKVFKTRDGEALPSIQDLMKTKGDPRAGEMVFKNTKSANCIRCHQIGNEGNMIGPPLTVIGSKLNKGQLYEAILYPSASILMHYETWVVKTKKGDVISGLLVEDTSDHVTIKDSDGKYHDVKVEDVARKVMQKISLMPEGLNEAMTRTDLVNLVEYLSRQRS